MSGSVFLPVMLCVIYLVNDVRGWNITPAVAVAVEVDILFVADVTDVEMLVVAVDTDEVKFEKNALPLPPLVAGGDGELLLFILPFNCCFMPPIIDPHLLLLLEE